MITTTGRNIEIDTGGVNLRRLRTHSPLTFSYFVGSRTMPSHFAGATRFCAVMS